ncbi:hypothetical protein [Paraburkholderia sp. JPY419]|uniref:hypothetical protein n=1 Tax=Paraburkholderia sp. JPY419 TaxID=667660 RepID=UPI003D1D36E6
MMEFSSYRRERKLIKADVSWIMAHCAGSESCGDTVRSAATVVPQVDHRVGECLERVVERAETFEAQQQAAKLILPATGCRLFSGVKTDGDVSWVKGFERLSSKRLESIALMTEKWSNAKPDKGLWWN